MNCVESLLVILMVNYSKFLQNKLSSFDGELWWISTIHSK